MAASNSSCVPVISSDSVISSTPPSAMVTLLIAYTQLPFDSETKIMWQFSPTGIRP